MTAVVASLKALKEFTINWEDIIELGKTIPLLCQTPKYDIVDLGCEKLQDVDTAI